VSTPDSNSHEQGEEVNPSRRDRLRPLELVGFSAVLAAFAAGVVALTTRDWKMLVPVTAGIVFIVSLLGLALLGLGMKPNAEDEQARQDLKDIDDPDTPTYGSGSSQPDK
jgi:hypothetical protein